MVGMILITIFGLFFPILYHFLGRKKQSGSKPLLLLPRLVSLTQVLAMNKQS